MSKQELANKKDALPSVAPVLSPRMQEYLAEQESGSDMRLKFLTTAGATFKYDGSEIPNNAIAVIVLDSISTNILYRTKYNVDNPTPPDCFAFGRGRDLFKMVPHEESIEKVAENCGVCPLSKFGSAPQIEWKKSAKGCGCNMKRRLALISIGEVLKDGKIKLDPSMIEESEICYLSVPVTSVAAFESYKSTFVKVKKAPLCFAATLIRVHPDPNTMIKLTFQEIKSAVDVYGAEHPVSLFDPVIMAKIEARQEEAAAVIETPFSAMFNADEQEGVTVDTRAEKF